MGNTSRTEHFHDWYLAAWNHAMSAGDSTPIEAFLAAGYHGGAGQEAAAAGPFDGETARSGFRYAVTDRALLMESRWIEDGQWLLCRDLTDVGAPV